MMIKLDLQRAENWERTSAAVSRRRGTKARNDRGKPRGRSRGRRLRCGRTSRAEAPMPTSGSSCRTTGGCGRKRASWRLRNGRACGPWRPCRRRTRAIRMAQEKSRSCSSLPLHPHRRTWPCESDENHWVMAMYPKHRANWCQSSFKLFRGCPLWIDSDENFRKLGMGLNNLEQH